MYSRFTRSSTEGMWQAASFTFSTRTCDNDTRSEKTVRMALYWQLKHGEIFNRQLGSELRSRNKRTRAFITPLVACVAGVWMGRERAKTSAQSAKERTRIPPALILTPPSPLLWPAAQATPREEFENAAKFLRIGQPSTLIRHENGAFRKGSSNWRNMKSSAFRFRVFAGKRFENGAFWKTMISR